MTAMANLRLKEIRKKKKITLEQLSERTGLSVSQLSRIESGKRRALVENLRGIADAIGVSLGELVADSMQEVAVVGYVGAGQVVFPIDDHPVGAGLDTIMVPAVLGNVVAVVARGDSMYPRYREGDILIYRRQNDDPRDLIGHECVVALRDGSVYVKTLRRGSLVGTFTLESFNAPPIEDRQIEWAAPIRWIVRAST